MGAVVGAALADRWPSGNCMNFYEALKLELEEHRQQPLAHSLGATKDQEALSWLRHHRLSGAAATTKWA